LFWVVELPDKAFGVSHDGRSATLEAEDVCLVNSFQFFGPNNVAAKVSLKVRWEATGPAVRRGRGGEVPPTDRAAFLGRIAPARSTAWFPGPTSGSASAPTRGSAATAATPSWAGSATAPSSPKGLCVGLIGHETDSPGCRRNE
jgi:hypothetical protein